MPTPSELTARAKILWDEIQGNGDEHAIRVLTGLLMAADGWQTMDSAPMDGAHILVRDRSGHHEVKWAFSFRRGRDGDINGWMTNDAREIPSPSHWMPLPSPPSQ